MKLRISTFEDVAKETFILDLPVVFEGTPEECKNYAEKENYVWVREPRNLFGGFWRNEMGSPCLLPT